MLLAWLVGQILPSFGQNGEERPAIQHFADIRTEKIYEDGVEIGVWTWQRNLK